MSKIQNIDIGTVTDYEETETTTFMPTSIAADIGVYEQNLVSTRKTIRISGFMIAPTQATIQSLYNLRNHGLICLMDLDDIKTGIIRLGKITSLRIMASETEADIHDYQLEFSEQPAIGTTYLQTADAALHDLDYRVDAETFNPTWGKHNPVWSSDRLTLSYEFYLDNDKDSAQDLIIEAQVGDDINKFKLYYWTGSVWTLIGDWGGADAWDAQKNFSDPNAVSHTVRANKGERGADLTFGIISRKLGCKIRVLFSVSNMSAQSGTDQSTDYGSDQLLLKATIEHTQRETLRPYPIMTYIDGGLRQKAA